MKKLALAAAFASMGSLAFAAGHGKDDVVMETEPMVVVEEAQAGSSAAGILIPLALLTVLAVAMND